MLIKKILSAGAYFGTLAILLSSAPAKAGCHLIDCVEDVYVEKSELQHASCETLWILRNSIFKSAKYCFKSARATAWFGNEGCQFDDADAVPLNEYQRSNVGVITQAEQERGC